MKKYLFLCLIALFTTSAMAQDAMPTKEETVNYLNKKSQEILDHSYTTALWGRVQYSKISVSLKGDKIELKYEGKGSKDETDCNIPLRSEIIGSYQFNPAHISRMALVRAERPNEPVRMLRVYFTAKTVRSSGYGEGRNGCGGSNYTNSDRLVISTDEMDLPIFVNDPTNLTKIQKALLYLRDLAKAEDDPFGN